MSVCILWKIIKKQREKIVGLKKVYRLLGERCTQLLKDKGNLIDKTTELQHKVDTLQGFLDHDIEYDMDKAIQNLKKENAELELKYLRATDEGTSFAHLKSLERKNENQKNQLTKAKEILAKLLEEEKNNMYWEMNGSDKTSYYEVIKQAEQLLEK